MIYQYDKKSLESIPQCRFYFRINRLAYFAFTGGDNFQLWIAHYLRYVRRLITCIVAVFIAQLKTGRAIHDVDWSFS